MILCDSHKRSNNHSNARIGMKMNPLVINLICFVPDELMNVDWQQHSYQISVEHLMGSLGFLFQWTLAQ